MNIAGVMKWIGGGASATKTATGSAWRGATGAVGVAGTGFALYSSHQMYANKYGAGAAFAIGAAESAFYMLPPSLSLPVAAMYYGGQAAYDYGQANYRNNRKLNMGQPVQDRFGTIATMRQRSAQTLQRGRAVLGSEARLMHY